MHGVRSHDQSIWKNGKFDPPRKYKMAKDIQTPPSSNVAELSCCAKPSKIGPPNFDGGIGKVWVFLLTQTDNESNKFFHLAYRSQIWKDLKLLWRKMRGFTPLCAFWGYRWWQIMFRGPNPPQKKHFWGPFNAKPIIERALCKSHVNGATKLKLYSYNIGIGKYLGACQNFSARGRP